ncbi:MAG TPA: tRNA (adenosine(37)-N6)-threonylcarbamoyltransferase complex dimerization subunit type 1 TsaB [Alphaproteobacteria bacterium]|jgi:tRNA threonylcarbamoyladenosine biosynthesis protein TsaB|nr:tRNA (adenosine(37)-N6)-threonylcarbamoyltransferase complex dimerization subunit type 1 TsaB [Alphaproteobacteria bacterium]
MAADMKVLAFDTTLEACSAALWQGGQVLAVERQHIVRGHAEALMPMVESVMAEAGFEYDALDLIAVTRGPGTFTGLRIGLAAARGLGLACGRPVLGLTSLEALAAGVPAGDESLFVAIDARRGEVYGQAFDASLVPLCEPFARSPAAAAEAIPEGPALVLGSGAALIRETQAGEWQRLRFSPGNEQPDAAVVAARAAALAAAGGLPEVPPAPLYLRQPDARLP